MRRVVLPLASALLAGSVVVPVVLASGDLGALPSADAAADIPARVLVAYQRASATCAGLRWQVLAGIGKVESDHGRAHGGTIDAAGAVTPALLGPPLDGGGAGGNTTPLAVGRFAGQWGLGGDWQRALGPMQLLPGTFSAWAADGDEDGRLDPHDVDDAAATAAAYLCGRPGGVTDEAEALSRYNRSESYVAEVLAWATRYAGTATPLTVGSASADALLRHPNVVLSADGRADLASGRVDLRVVTVLSAVADHHRITVTSLVTGHPRCAVNGQAHGPGCTVSNHYLGRAADIASIDGVPVSARNATAVDLVRQLASLPAELRPSEIGGPLDTGDPGVFANAYHQNHIHFGYDR